MSRNDYCKHCGSRIYKPLLADISALEHYTELDKDILKKILNDPRVKRYERRSGRFKRVWIHEPAIKAIHKIKGEYN